VVDLVEDGAQVMRAILIAPLLALGACAGIGFAPPPKPLEQMTKQELCEYSVTVDAAIANGATLVGAIAAIWGVDPSATLEQLQAQLAKARASRDVVCVVE
jgi:hypothetical protein